jgi:hypothetical protein
MENGLRGGDYCKLFHREAEGHMSAKYNDEDIRMKIDPNSIDHLFDRILSPETSTAQLYSVYAKLTPSKEKQNHNSLAIFQVENESLADGHLIQWNKPIRFKHCTLKTLLYFNSFIILIPI